MISRLASLPPRLAARFRKPRKRFYLVAPSGVPNFGDEFIARAWLDWLAKRHPGADVWLDCIEPGRAAHLFADTHPRLHVTNTLWQLAHDRPLGDPGRDADRVRESLTRLGTPRLDIGLEALRTMTSVHLLGGGYMNALWPENLAILSALAELKARFGVPIYATGQGLLPQDARTHPLVAEQLEGFDYVESRDAAGSKTFALALAPDDAFLAFVNSRPVFAPYATPDVMLLMQGDFLEPAVAESVLARVVELVGGRTVGVIEGLPPDDARFWPEVAQRFPQVERFPFMRVWQEGFPARPGQSWVTTRFHFHLLAASAGANGVAVAPDAEYYGVKHDLLRALGTGWSIDDPTLALKPASEPSFSAHLKDQYAAEKEATARRIYG